MFDYKTFTYYRDCILFFNENIDTELPIILTYIYIKNT